MNKFIYYALCFVLISQLQSCSVFSAPLPYQATGETADMLFDIPARYESFSAAAFNKQPSDFSLDGTILYDGNPMNNNPVKVSANKMLYIRIFYYVDYEHQCLTDINYLPLPKKVYRLTIGEVTIKDENKCFVKLSQVVDGKLIPIDISEQNK